MGLGCRYILIAMLICTALLAGEENISTNTEAHTLLKKEGEEPFKNASEFKFPEKYKKELEGYKSNWTRLTNYEFSGLHWKQFIVIYVNKEPINYVKNYIEYGRVYLDNDDDEEEKEPTFIKYSKGTIFVKEHFLSINGKPADPISTVIMKKREKGYDPENGDWEYAQFATNGTLIMEGNSKNKAVYKSCIECHKNMEDRDYIFATHSILELKE